MRQQNINHTYTRTEKRTTIRSLSLFPNSLIWIVSNISTDKHIEQFVQTPRVLVCVPYIQYCPSFHPCLNKRSLARAEIQHQSKKGLSFFSRLREQCVKMRNVRRHNHALVCLAKGRRTGEGLAWGTITDVFCLLTVDHHLDFHYLNCNSEKNSP